MIITFLLLVLVGVAAGLLAGLFGIGGGILFAPVLLFMFQSAGIPNTVLWTIGTSLSCNFVSAVSSSYKHYQNGNIFLREGLMVGSFGIAGTIAGRFIATSPYYSEFEFTIFFSLLLLYSVYHFLKKKQPEKNKPDNVGKRMRWYHALLLGLAAGVIASLAGVGGGLTMVPAMAIFLSFGFRKAVSVSSMAIVLITFSGWFQMALLTPLSAGLTGFNIGYVDFGAALPLIIGGIIGARYGVFLLNVIRMRSLEIFFAVFVFLVAGRLLYGLF